MNNIYFVAYLNCIIETFILMILWNILSDERFPKRKIVLTFSLLCISSILIAYFESSLLLLSFILLFSCTYIGFGKIGIQKVFLNTLFSLLFLMYIQTTIMWFFPAALIPTAWGQLNINLVVLLIAFFLKVLAKKIHCAEFYEKNKRNVWAFILLLFLPSIIIMQIVATNLNESNRLLVFCLLLLQFSYLLALILSFVLFYRKQERRQIKHTTEAIDSLNLYMEDSRRRIHDFNKHIHFLHSIVCTQSSDSELKTTVDNYCREILNSAEQEEIMLQLDDPIFRALLYRREIQARKFGIDLQIEGTAILPAFPMKNFQLVEIFDNLLDNAFECVSQLEENRWIRISLQTFPMKNGCSNHILCVRNPYDSLDFSSIINKKGYTSKGGEHQGIGLQKISQIISTTGGKLVLNHDNNVFTVKVSYENSLTQ